MYGARGEVNGKKFSGRFEIQELIEKMERLMQDGGKEKERP
jgi:hypothetical protein